MIDETVQFGALQVTPRVCHTRPPTEPAQTTAFVEVDEITLANKIQRLFTGWMFAASPGLHAVEHPVYDVWLVDCKLQEDPSRKRRFPPRPMPSRNCRARRKPRRIEGVARGGRPYFRFTAALLRRPKDPSGALVCPSLKNTRRLVGSKPGLVVGARTKTLLRGDDKSGL